VQGPAGGGARRRLRPRRRPGMGGKERGGRGESIPVLTSRYCIRWRRLREEAVARRRCKGGGGLWSSWEGRRWLCVCCVEVRRSGEPSVPFIGGKRRFGRGDIFSGEVAGELGRLRDGSAGQLEQGFGRGLDPSCRRGAGFAGRWWNGRLGRGLMAARRVGRR
jgi:hypothetical protein